LRTGEIAFSGEIPFGSEIRLRREKDRFNFAVRQSRTISPKTDVFDFTVRARAISLLKRKGDNMELWDAYDSNFNKIKGVTLKRGETIPKGLYHLVCDIIVRHTDGEYLLMQRDIHKHFGGMWEATAGGSALKGETPFDCAKRELFEETGISSDKLKEVGRVVSDENKSVYVEFFCETDCDKSSVVLQEGETSDYKWVSRDELVNMKKSQLVTQRMQRFIEELQE
jgi:8-oxo-dGTP pyrophosphatase MutT (NUDIX family)